jgi:hypothetical protein
VTGLSLPSDKLYRITAPHFCCGLTVAYDGSVTSAAPIIQRWAFNSTLAYVRRFCAERGWVLEECK